MSQTMKDVKAITIPEGTVKKIEINGVVVWQGGRTLDSIAISGYTTTFNVGNTFSFGGTVIATYDNGETEDVTNQATFSGYNMSTAGSQTVTVSFTDGGITKTATYSITVYKVLTKITLSGQTTSLNRGAAFSFGGTVTATYNDGSTANVTSSTTFSGYNMSTAGTYTVTASYTYRSVTKTATYSLTVNKVWTKIWSGTKTSDTSTTSSMDVATLSSLSGTVTLRVTWSCSSSGNGGSVYYYNNNGSTTTISKPGSPFQFNLATGTTRNYIVGLKRVNSSSLGCNKYLTWNKSSKKFTITYGIIGSYAGDQKISMTISKIEQYY